MNEGKFLFIGSTDKQIGKTFLAVGLAGALKKRGYKVGYFKPLGQRLMTLENGEIVEEDAYSIKRILGLKDKLETISPIFYHVELLHKTLTSDVVDALKKKILETGKEIAEGKDLVIAEGLDVLWTGLAIDLSIWHLANMFNSPLISLTHYTPLKVFDNVVLIREAAEKFKTEYLGAVIMGVTPEKDERFREYYFTILESGKYKILGVMPGVREIIPITPKELVEAIDAKILVGEDALDKPIEEFLIGAMTPESALRYLRVTTNKALITGGDRTDILLAALETPTSAIILTGNLQPDHHVLLKAEERNIPLLLTPYDTYLTMKKIEETGYTIKFLSEAKLQRIINEVEKRINVEEIIEKMGLQKEGGGN